LIQQDNGQAGNYGFREGRWKLVRHDSRSAHNTVVERTLGREPVPQFQLFDLETDPGETRDVSAAHPEVAARLQARLAQLIAAGRSRG
jgi:arylsulfatase A